MGKIFEKRFKNSSEAIAYADAAGWDYKGKSGFFHKYDRYVGETLGLGSSDTDCDNTVLDILELRVYSDGQTSIDSPSNIDFGQLPNQVCISEHSYWFAKFMRESVNNCLADRQAGIKVGYIQAARNYPIINEQRQIIENIDFPTKALSHEANPIPLSDKEIQDFVTEKHREYNNIMGNGVRIL